jgi:iron(III) transport system substrate-binding protein
MKVKVLGLVLVILAVIGGLTAGATQLKGRIVLYTASGPEITTPIIELFNAKYPDIEIITVKAGTPEIFARLRAEKERPAADVVLGGSPLFYNLNSDLFEPYVHPETDYFVTYDPNHIWHPFSIFTQPLIVNTELVHPEDFPRYVLELFVKAPKWLELGGIALPDPAKSGTGWTIISGLSGAFSWDFWKQLLPYIKIFPGSDPAFLAVKDGECPIGWINEDLGAKWEAAGAPVKMIYPKDAITVQMDAFGLVKNGPNPELAKLFVDFLGTKEVQELVVKIVKRRPARIDVPPPAELPPLGELNLYVEAEPRDVVVAKIQNLLKELGK